MQRRRHLYILHRNATKFSGPEVIWDRPKDSENMFSLFLGKMDIGFYVPKMKKTIQTVTNKKCENQPLWWYGGALVPTAWVISICVKVPLMQTYVGIFERHMLPGDEVDRALLHHVPTPRFLSVFDFLDGLSLKRTLRTELKSNSIHGNKMRSYSSFLIPTSRLPVLFILFHVLGCVCSQKRAGVFYMYRVWCIV